MAATACDDAITTKDGPVTSTTCRAGSLIKTTLEISREAAHLCVTNKQLTLKRSGIAIGSTACEDICIVVVDHPQTTYTHAALISLAASGANPQRMQSLYHVRL